MKSLQHIILFSVTTFLIILSGSTAANAPKIIQGNNLSISGFRVSGEQLKPYIHSGYEAVPDQNGEYMLLMGAGHFSKTHGIAPYHVFALFVAVREVGKEEKPNQFMPIWGANSTTEAVSTYQNLMGLPFHNPSKLTTSLSEKGKQKVSYKSPKGKGKLEMIVQKLPGEDKKEFSEPTLIGKINDQIHFTKEAIGFAFTDGSIKQLKVEANKDSALRLVDHTKHIFTLVSDSHAAVLYP